MPPLFRVIINSAVIGIYDKKTPVSTAVFFSPTRALTAYHDARPKVGVTLTGVSDPNVKPVRNWKFKVVAASPKADLVVLEIISGPTPAHFLPITIDPAIDSIADTTVWLTTFGISAAKKAAENPFDISLGSFRHAVDIAAIGKRHFVYHTNTGRGDSGGAVISLTGQLVGLHLGGWNVASPPSSPVKGDDDAAAGGSARGKKASKQANGAAGAQIIKNKERNAAMGLAELGTATRKSILKLSEDLSAGGYAIYLGSSAIAALCTSASTGASSSNGSAALSAASTTGVGAGGKRTAGDAGLGHGASGGKKRK
jgi:hypothetical protein